MIELGSARVSRANASAARTFGVAPKRTWHLIMSSRRFVSCRAQKVREPETASPAREIRALPRIDSMHRTCFSAHQRCVSHSKAATE